MKSNIAIPQITVKPGAPVERRKRKRVVDNDLHKGATEDNRPGPKGSGHPGLDKNGLPNDPVAIAQDVLGAEVDKSQG
jgi:hypothetical protein